MKPRGYTLIELLVVLGIVIFLTAILLPGMSRSRKLAQALHCANNIKQITINLIAYDSKNDHFPYSYYLNDPKKEPPGGSIGNLIYDDIGYRWQNYIISSKKDIGNAGKSIFWCPSRRINKKEFKSNVLAANYGVNQSVCKLWLMGTSKDFSGSPLRATDIVFPDKTILIVDSGYYTINWYQVTNFPPKPLGNSVSDRSYIPGLSINKDRSIVSGMENDAKNGRHLSKSVNVGFVDGHVKRHRAEDLLVEKTDDGYKNLTPLWVPRKK